MSGVAELRVYWGRWVGLEPVLALLETRRRVVGRSGAPGSPEARRQERVRARAQAAVQVPGRVTAGAEARAVLTGAALTAAAPGVRQRHHPEQRALGRSPEQR